MYFSEVVYIIVSFVIFQMTQLQRWSTGSLLPEDRDEGRGRGGVRKLPYSSGALLYPNCGSGLINRCTNTVTQDTNTQYC